MQAEVFRLARIFLVNVLLKRPTTFIRDAVLHALQYVVLSFGIRHYDPNGPPLEPAIQIARQMFGLRRRCCYCWLLSLGSLLRGTDGRKSDIIKDAGSDHQ
jgi:hypothetical protein